MIDIKQAIDLVDQRFFQYPVDRVLDLGNRWVICFNAIVPPAKVPVPGIHPVTVDKATGEIGFLPVPPLENLHVIERASEIWRATES